MAVGGETTAEDKIPLRVRREEIESVSKFPYLGSVISSTGRIDSDVDKCIAQASRAYGALREPVFMDKDLQVTIKQKIYQACVLSVLWHGSECWTPLRNN